MMKWQLSRGKVFEAAKPILAIALGLGVGLFLTGLAGESPWHVFKILVHSAFGSRYDLGMTLFYATPLIFTGLSVAVAFHAGMFNIGAEGQLELGALAAVATGILMPHLPFPLAPVCAVLMAILAGVIWGGIPGWLRAKRGAHEVINTIMLNFISAGLCSWAILYLFRNYDSQNPETRAVGSGFLIDPFKFFDGAPLNVAFFLALMTAGLFWFFLWKTALGFEIRAVGQNEKAASFAGIRAGRTQVIAMMLAGGLAGMAGISEVLGHSGRMKLGFSPGYGFMGIAVALLGRNHPLGVVLSSILFGALHKGTSDLDLETENVTRDFSQILQALIILSVTAEGLWNYFGKKLKFKKEMEA